MDSAITLLAVYPGDNRTCVSCDGTPGGSSTVDHCGVCGGTGTLCDAAPLLAKEAADLCTSCTDMVRQRAVFVFA